MLARHTALLTMMATLIMLLGCSGGPNPVAPGQDNLETGQIQSASAGYEKPDGTVCLGLWDVFINPDTWEAEAVPLRTAELTMEVTRFFQTPYGNASALQFHFTDTSQFATNGEIKLDLGLTHPIYAPQWTVFDVMGVVIFNGSHSSFYDPTAKWPEAPTDPVMLNPDGYTRWMNPSEFTTPGLFGYEAGNYGYKAATLTATLNGFKYYADGLMNIDTIPDYYHSYTNVDKRGMFTWIGPEKRRELYIKFPMVSGKPDLRFQYGVIGRFQFASPHPPVNVPDDFPMDANAQEAFYVKVTDAGSTLNYNSAVGGSGDLILDIEVFDWQGWNDPSNFSDEIGAIIVENIKTGLIAGDYTDAWPTATESAGSCINSRIYRVDIPNCAPTDNNPVSLMVAVESADPTTYDPVLTPAAYPTSAKLAAYNSIIGIAVTNYANSRPSVPTPTGPSSITDGGICLFTCAASDADAGDQLSYMWSIVPQGTSPSYTIPGDPPQPAANPGTQTLIINMGTAFGTPPGVYDVSCQVQDNSGQPNDTGTSLAPMVIYVNTPPIVPTPTGPASVLNNTLATFTCAATDPDPGQSLIFLWSIVSTGQPANYIIPGDNPPGTNTLNIVLGTTTGYPPGNYDVSCHVQDSSGAPNDTGTSLLPLFVTVSTVANNTPVVPTPTTATPAPPSYIWDSTNVVFSCAASDADPSDNLIYTWSIVTQGSLAIYNIPGDPPQPALNPGTQTLTVNNFGSGTGYPLGNYDISCQVQDSSGQGNNTGTSPVPLTVSIFKRPYTTPVLPSQFDQVITGVFPSLQGPVGCNLFWERFYGPWTSIPFIHPDISILSGPSLGGTPGVMVIADEMAPGVIVPGLPAFRTGFAHFTCPYLAGMMPGWSWWTMGLFPGGPDMIPSVVHFDGNVNAIFLMSNNQLTGKIPATTGGMPIDDPSVFSHYTAMGPLNMNDLYTSLSLMGNQDIAADSTNGFDMGSLSNPDNPELYGLYTQDWSGIIAACGGVGGVGILNPNPVNFLKFPSMAAQPLALPVDMPGGPGTVASLPAGLVSTIPLGPLGAGLFCIGPNGPSRSGVPLAFPDAYYALAIDDDPSDNPWQSSFGNPVQWTLAATLDSERDLEVYEIDFGVPTPAPIAQWSSLAMGQFMGGNPTAYPLDCEFISNFTGNSGPTKQPEDFLAVLLTVSNPPAFCVEIFSMTPGTPTSVGMTMLVPNPSFLWPALVGGVAWRLDVDEATRDIYVLHESMAAPGGLAVTIFPY
jgi:hypothetical protein